MDSLSDEIPKEKTLFQHPFKNNKYTEWYFKLVSIQFTGDGYAEKHHIIPKAMGGDNSKTNLVRLTARQHFVAHRLLTKMTDGPLRRKAEAAFRAVAIMKSPKSNKKLFVLSSQLYEKLRKQHAANTSRRMKKLWASKAFREKMSTSQPKELRSKRAKAGRTPEVIELHRNSIIGRKHSDETKQKMRDARLLRFATDPSYKSKCVSGLAKGLEATRSRMKTP